MLERPGREKLLSLLSQTLTGRIMSVTADSRCNTESVVLALRPQQFPLGECGFLYFVFAGVESAKNKQKMNEIKLEVRPVVMAAGKI